jgi:hypothetical protein
LHTHEEKQESLMGYEYSTLIGMTALAATFAIPFAWFIVSGARSSRRIEQRSIEHTRERLAQ